MRFAFGDYLLDTQRHEFSRAGEPVPLWPTVSQVLADLLAHRDRVIRKQELLHHLWPGQAVADTALNSYIMAVRKVIRDHRPTPQLLRPVRGYGYRFVAPVDASEPASPAEPPPSGPSSGKLAPAHLPPSVATPTNPQPNATDPDSSPDGEYKPVAVLCCALSEVPARTTQSDREAQYRLMQTAFGIVYEVISHYGTDQSPSRQTA